mmetsp:Transcript_50120/g.92502  ORF Transcript_50120/g.92502 Transcript_50120/m.92502 type:complete len:700 (+) Transcript_50120:46-2145(+)
MATLPAGWAPPSSAPQIRQSQMQSNDGSTSFQGMSPPGSQVSSSSPASSTLPGSSRKVNLAGVAGLRPAQVQDGTYVSRPLSASVGGSNGHSSFNMSTASTASRGGVQNHAGLPTLKELVSASSGGPPSQATSMQEYLNSMAKDRVPAQQRTSSPPMNQVTPGAPPSGLGGVITGTSPARSSTDMRTRVMQSPASPSFADRETISSRSHDHQPRQAAPAAVPPSASQQAAACAGQQTLFRPTPADENAPVVIALDVDEVLVCYVDGFRKFLQRERPDSPCDIDTAFHEAHHPRSPWRLQFAMNGGLDNLEAVPGAAAALRKLRAAGIRLEAVTSRPPIMRQSTEALLLKLFPPDTFSAAHFAGPGEKGHTCNMIRAQALVDDQLPNILDAANCNVTGVLFDLCRSYPWCRAVRIEDLPQGTTCKETWADAAEYLLHLFAPQLRAHQSRRGGPQQPSKAALDLETRQVLPAGTAQVGLGPPTKASASLSGSLGGASRRPPQQEPPREYGAGLSQESSPNSLAMHPSYPPSGAAAAASEPGQVRQSFGKKQTHQVPQPMSAIEESPMPSGPMDHVISFDPRRGDQKRLDEAFQGRDAYASFRGGAQSNNYAHPSTAPPPPPRPANDYAWQEQDVRAAPTTLLSTAGSERYSYDRPEEKTEPVPTTPLGSNLLAGVGGLFGSSSEMDARSREGTDSQGCVIA